MLRDLLRRWLVPEPAPIGSERLRCTFDELEAVSRESLNRIREAHALWSEAVRSIESKPGALGSIEPAFKAGAVLAIRIPFDFVCPVEPTEADRRAPRRPASLDFFWTSIADQNGVSLALVKFERRMVFRRQALYAATEWLTAPSDGASLPAPYLQSFLLLAPGAT